MKKGYLSKILPDLSSEKNKRSEDFGAGEKHLWAALFRAAKKV